LKAFDDWGAFIKDPSIKDDPNKKNDPNCVNNKDKDGNPCGLPNVNVRLVDENMEKIINTDGNLTRLFWNQADMCMIIRTSIAEGK